MTAPDPADAGPIPLGRWEPFILGMVFNSLITPDAAVLGLHMIRATPDEPNPYLYVATHASVDGLRKQYYKITVERVAEPPPSD